MGPLSIYILTYNLHYVKLTLSIKIVSKDVKKMIRSPFFRNGKRISPFTPTYFTAFKRPEEKKKP